MSESDSMDVDTQTHEAEGSWLDGWPAMLLSLVIIAAALYSFSPRPPGDFPATKISEDTLLVTDVAERNGRYIGVGEQGQILFADSSEGPWKSAKLAQNRGSTFTAVAFVTDQVAVAVGHDAWIVRSEDAGQSWAEAYFDAEKAEALLGVDTVIGKDGSVESIIAYGAFGQIQISKDGGQSWARDELVKEDEPAEEAAAESGGGSSDPFSDDYDPFASFGGGGGFSFDDFATRHLNDLLQASNDMMYMVGERGLVARSKDGGKTWKQVDPGYSGSFYGAHELANGRIVVHGMRGNIYYTDDHGESWEKSQVPVPASMYGGAVDSNGNLVLAGSSNTLIVSKDGGESFTQMSVKDSDTLADVLPLSADKWLTAGEAGIQVQTAASAG